MKRSILICFLVALSAVGHAEVHGSYGADALDFVAQMKGPQAAGQDSAIAGIRGMGLIGNIVLKTLAQQQKANSLRASHQSLVSFAKGAEPDSDLAINENFDLLVKSFSCTTCQSEEDKTALFSDLVIQSDELGRHILNPRSVNPQAEESLQEKITQLLGINASKENINLLKFVVAQASLSRSSKNK